MKFFFRGFVFTGFGKFPVEHGFDANSLEDAIRVAGEEANRMFLLERNTVTLNLFDEKGNLLKIVRAPSDDLAEPVRLCEIHGCKNPARYRECYYDSSMEVCEQHLDDAENRRERYDKRILETVYDLKEKKALHPVTLTPLLFITTL